MMLSSPSALAAAAAAVAGVDDVVVVRIEWIRPERNERCGMSSAAAFSITPTE